MATEPVVVPIFVDPLNVSTVIVPVTVPDDVLNEAQETLVCQLADVVAFVARTVVLDPQVAVTLCVKLELGLFIVMVIVPPSVVLDAVNVDALGIVVHVCVVLMVELYFELCVCRNVQTTENAPVPSALCEYVHVPEARVCDTGPEIFIA